MEVALERRRASIARDPCQLIVDLCDAAGETHHEPVPQCANLLFQRCDSSHRRGPCWYVGGVGEKKQMAVGGAGGLPSHPPAAAPVAGLGGTPGPARSPLPFQRARPPPLTR